MDYDERIAAQLNVDAGQVTSAVGLLDGGNTIPFISRYRKEVTGGLDEEQLRQIDDSLRRLRALDERRQTIMASIKAQGLLDPDLHQRLLSAETRTELEDLYQPYKPRRRTRASAARESGLQGLADLILKQPRTRQTLAQIAEPFLSDEVPTIENALCGARDIVAETISYHAEVRGLTREKALTWATLRSEKVADADDPRGTYKLYYASASRVDRLLPHQVLAINRGEAEKVLRARVEIPERDWRQAIARHFRPDPRSLMAEHLEMAIDDAAKRLLLPAIERDVRRTKIEEAETHAIAVFASNLRALLSQPPLPGHTVLGIDPGYRTGCKVAVVDPTGKVLDTATIYPHEPQKHLDEALRVLTQLCEHHRVTLVAIGNGTASRETEQLAAGLIRDMATVRYIIVSEAGASVYSASRVARAELPDMDVSLRGAVSIARRVQDPLAELVKIDPKSLGVGLYQHDVHQKQLAQSLDGVVESVVNSVGLDVNTASPALLGHVAGIGPRLAERIVAYRNANGPFPNRKALTDVSGLGPNAFEQAAGFLRIRDGDTPLDASSIHPESYPVAEAVLELAGLTPHTPPAMRKQALAKLQESMPLSVLAGRLGTGPPTLADILQQLVRPGRDPREELPAPILRSDVLSMEDLRPGMQLNGTVRNVVDFGAFVDIGVKHDGLLHRSQIPRGAEVGVGDVLAVVIRNVEIDRERISLGWPPDAS